MNLERVQKFSPERPNVNATHALLEKNLHKHRSNFGKTKPLRRISRARAPVIADII
jgi:hypothetical protein